MRKLYFLPFIILFPLFMNAQVRVGLIGGPHWASVTETNNIPGWDTDVKPFYTTRNAAHVGLIGEIPLGIKNFYLQPAIMYVGKGRKFYSYDSLAVNHKDTVSVQSNLSINYIEIPFNLAYKIPLSRKKNISFLVSAGLYFSFLYDGSRSSEIRTIDSSRIKVKSSKLDLEPGKGVDKYKTSDFGFNLRGGFELGGVVLTAFMSQGLTDFYKAGYDGSFKHKVYGASATIWLNRGNKQAAKPKAIKLADTDYDGVPDRDDLCPLIYGDSASHGCLPDKDTDGIADASDRCPDVAGVKKYNGCPIPDTDKDGVNDELDSCRQIAGVAKYNGCPIPDKDGDGVNDENDKCPDSAGTAANNGCPEVIKEIQQKIAYEATNIFFDTNSDNLTKASWEAIERVAVILKANPELKITIEGYSDNSGVAKKNLLLSQKRANSAKRALEKSGIESSRINAIGYGQQSPIADNTTAEGRVKNRRVEIKIQ